MAHIDPLTSFRLVQSVKAHFSQPKYDYMKYGLNARKFTETAFDRRKDRYFFEKLGSNFKARNEMADFLASTFVFDPDVWVGDLCSNESAWDNWKSHKGFMAALSYNVKEDTIKLIDSMGGFKVSFIDSGEGRVPFVDGIITGLISPETAAIYDRCFGIFGVIDSNTDFDRNPIWEKMRLRLTKFKPFVTIPNVEILESIKQSVFTAVENNSYTSI